MAASEQGFREWMTAVDSACQRLSGLSVYDLPDQCFRDEFEAGTRPAVMARQALKEEGW